ncbi:uncharacterized protein LOC107771610 [Nicotiana tabacum]|uniref:Uncharacterized protein LOC107771610 n=2 Tax=Nicotiana tabacum TaxID=4097 RepID=A0A1S3Y2Z8_TOBAC|nr:uncharacterized protein LOC104106037 [Nicotiana tomentosiformis]XP_009612798.1 uncharacterized protein LOC104106037 [Nicotiana tomentosiformis]XP_009612800.1 uncharacterized protein LOC104106037 [Nicotiana tomentosiformis]XP_016446509.1 PREDICTED: uncharacterized protein LOC107771610 [Nicotiana tabacum]XP_018629613.1 uncharacterized protein LOC104106037 [Nicotiana tomentosiformis]
MMTILTSSSIFLLKEIIFEMLSYLPVKSLLRFKCVCKHWNATTQDFQFICLHFKRCPVLINKKPLEIESYATGFIILSTIGLILEYLICWVASSPNFIYRIRNPEMHQILEIPDSQNPILNMHMVVDTDNQLLKLLSVIHVIGDPGLPLGYEVLDLRNEEGTYSWQTLDLPKESRGETTILQNRICRHSTLFKIVDAIGTAYSMWDTTNSHIGIDIVDMVNDSYIGHTTFPNGFYSKDDCILWKRKLSFAKVVKDEVHVMVLEDYNKQQIKWAEAKLIIKLPFLKEVVQEQIKVLVGRRSKLCFSRWNWDKKSICTYDFKTGKVTTIVSSCNNSDLFEFITPCLFACKGMHADRLVSN